MQTFLPKADLIESLECLDRLRLGKQRVETFQLLVAAEDPWAWETRVRRTGNTKEPKGWKNHPAKTMWDGYTEALKLYYNYSIYEWIRRGYNNTMERAPVDISAPMPPWFGDDKLHSSHRSNLLRKDSNYYSIYGWSEDTKQEYYWPTT